MPIGFIAMLLAISLGLYGVVRVAKADLRAHRRWHLRVWMIACVIAMSGLYWFATKYRFGYYAGSVSIMLDSGSIRSCRLIHGAQYPVYRWFFEEAHTWGTWWPRSNPLPPGAVWETEHNAFSLKVPVALSIIFAIVVFLKTRNPRPPWFCNECQYDLTGNTSGICSECGIAISPDQIDEVRGRSKMAHDGFE